mgnify:CR=1 FL=1
MEREQRTEAALELWRDRAHRLIAHLRSQGYLDDAIRAIYDAPRGDDDVREDRSQPIPGG